MNQAQRRLLVFALYVSAGIALCFGFVLRPDVPIPSALLPPDAASNPALVGHLTYKPFMSLSIFVSFVLPVFLVFAAIFVRLGGRK